jgi:MFS superfamily sulfate permease-like transporter
MQAYQEKNMADLFMLALLVGFSLLLMGLLRLCAWLMEN